MSTMNVYLPASLRLFVDDRVRKDGYSTSSEYVREPIRADAGSPCRARAGGPDARGTGLRAGQAGWQVVLGAQTQGDRPPTRGAKLVGVGPEAGRDVDHAVVYRVESEALAAAQQLLLELEVAFAGLGQSPKVGSPRYGHVLPGLRSWILRRHPYLIFPAERPRFIDVLRVLHLARDLPAALRAAD